MELKKDNNQMQNGGNQGQNQYGGPAQNQYGGAPQNQYGGVPQNQSPYRGGQSSYGTPSQTPGQSFGNQAPNGNSPYGGGSSYNGGPAYGNDYSTPKMKSSINPLVIILPILILVAIIGVSQAKKVFGGKAYTPGTFSGDVFTNDYFGFEVDLSSGKGWTKTSYTGGAEAELQTLKSGTPVTEFTAVNNKSLEFIGFGVLRTPWNVNSSNTSMQDFVESYKEQYKTELAKQGYNITSITQDKMTIAGKTCDGCIMTGTVTQGGQSAKVSAVQFYKMEDHYLGVYTAVSTSEGKAKLILTNYIKAK